MSKIRFKRTVLRAASALMQQGYQLSAPQPASRAVQFYKKTTTGVCCYIEFDLKDWPTLTGREFDVVLLRRRLLDFPTDEIRYEGLGISLSDLMWYVYEYAEVPLVHYWEFTDEQNLYEQLIRVQSLVIDYGIRWLENPESTDPWQILPSERDAFRGMLATVVAKELEPYGYKLKNIAVVDLPLFIKPLPNGLNAIVVFRQSRVLNPSRFVINVDLQRKLVDNPYEDQIPNFPGWISNRLETLLRVQFGVTPEEAPNQEEPDKRVANQVPSSQAFHWQYTEQSELQKCITDILDKLKRYALPWLDDPDSRDLWPALNQL